MDGGDWSEGSQPFCDPPPGLLELLRGQEIKERAVKNDNPEEDGEGREVRREKG